MKLPTKRTTRDVTVRSLTAALQAMLGDPDPARRIIAELEARSGWARIPAMLASLYDALGEVETAFRYAEEMVESRSARAAWLLSPSYRNLHGHPRFPDLLRRMKLRPGSLPLLPPATPQRLAANEDAGRGNVQ